MRFRRFEDEPALGLAAGWALKRLMLVTRHHHPVIGHRAKQNHSFAAGNTKHQCKPATATGSK
jgi:hypothetical protein